MTSLNDTLLPQLALMAGKDRLRNLPKLMAAANESTLLLTGADGRAVINFSSNDYLGLSRHADVIQAAMEATEAYGTGARSSRLIAGHIPQMAQLEESLAAYKNTASALVFSSGYAANIGSISALMNSNDLIICDKLSHASLLDGARLSGAQLHRFAHNDVKHLEKMLLLHRSNAANCLIVTESIFSMDGDIAPITNLIKLAKRYDCWLLVDDAHGFGFSDDLLAPVAAFENGIISGTLSKAVGGLGGYVAGPEALTSYLVNHARSFMFSTGLPPACIASALKAVQITSQNPTLAEQALSHAKQFTQLVGLPTAMSPIVPVIIGENDAVLKASQTLLDKGFYVGAIRPPTVPPGTARLRITFSAAHSSAQVEKLAQLVKEIIR